MIISIKQKIVLLLTAFVSTHALASNLVGSIEGEANSNMGVLNYKIPLALPADVNDIRPVVGIKYNSAANSGFSIYGTSVISRCSANKEIDGFIGRVNFDNFDKYCLDGSRLIATSGKAGEVDATYSNRIKNFSRITSAGGNTNNPDSWKIETKNGSILYYGVDSSSKNTQDQGNYRWHISSKEDRFGNKISYFYKNQAGKTVLDVINYNIHSVQFVYQTVGQSIKKYEYGATYYDNEVLKRVEVKTNNRLRRAYNFDYEVVGISNVARLKELELCDAENNCTKPTVFDWHQVDNTNPMLREDKTIFTGSKKFLSYQLTDVTADGQVEVCYPDYNGYIVCGSKKSSIGKSFSNLRKTLSTLQFNDLNHDGYADYCLSDESSGTYCAINKGNGSFASVGKWSNSTSSDDSNFKYLDINADKYTDLCVQSKTSLNCFLNNQGNNFNDVLSFNIAFNDPKKTFFTDINGDGASDVCGINNGFSCYLNTSIQNQISFSTKKMWSDNSNFTGNHNIVKDSLRITDFNNDGLPDACYIYADKLRCAINNGKKIISINEVAQIDGNWGVDINESAKNLLILDINQDSRVDACTHYNTGSYYCAFNKGDGRLGSIQQYAQFDPMSGEYGLSGYGRVAGGANPITFADVGGDGKVDVCYHSTSGVSCALSEANVGENLLKKIITPYRTTEFEYGALTNTELYTPATNNIIGMINVTPSLRVLKALITDNAAGTTNRLDYHYQGLRYDLEDGMRSFAKITKTNNATKQQTSSEFHQQGKLNGRAKKSIVFIDNKKVSENSYEYELIEYGKIHEIRETKTTAKNYDLQGNLLKTKTNQSSNYDKFSNSQTIVEKAQLGDSFYQLTTSSTYLNDEQNWLISKPITISTKHQNNNNTIVKNMAFYYDSKGALTMEIKEPGHVLSLTSKFTYDSFGNKIQTLISDNQSNQRTAAVEYANNGVNIIKKINALGHSESLTYDDFCAKPLTSTGPNGLTTTWQYDGLCRQTLERRADSTTTQTKYNFSEDYQLAIGDVNTSKYKVTTTVSGTKPSSVYYDAFGNTVRKTKIGFNGKTILKDSIYNDRGLLKKTTLPYYQGLFAGDNTAWTRYEYDDLGRKIKQTRPSSNGDINTEFSYTNNTTTTTDALGNDRTVHKNAQDKVSKVIDADASAVANQYDAIGNQTSSSINSRIGSTMAYDIMGNKTSMNDISMGQWTYTYNAFGELISQRDAKGQVSSTQYDDLGRVISKTSTEGTNVFVYDTATNGIGKIASEQSPVKTTRYAYDEFGRLKTTNNNIKDQEFEHSVAYDSYSRPSALFYPNNVVIKRRYNNSGYLKSIVMPKSQVWTPELVGMQNALDDYMGKINKLNELATKYEQQAKEKISLADRARQSADALTQQANNEESRAKRLEGYADDYEEYSAYYSRKASEFRSSARQYYNWVGNRAMRLISKQSNGWVKYEVRFSRGKDDYHYWWNLKGFFSNNAWPQYLHIGKMLNERAAKYERYAGDKTNTANNYNNQAKKLKDQASQHRQEAATLYKTAENHYKDARKLADSLRIVQKDLVDYEGSAATIQENINTYMAEIGNEEILIWSATSMDASDRLSGQIYGNGVLTRHRYDNLTGQLNSIQSEFGSQKLRDLHYQYNEQNSVTRMLDNVADAEQNYAYDVRDQLISMGETIAGNTIYKAYTFDAFGNMTYKSDVGTMSYNNKNQLTNLNRNDGTNTNYNYDANGNQLTGSSRTIQWTSFNKAKLITGNNASTELSYDANHNRAVQTIRNDGVKIEDGEDKYWVKRGKWGGSFESKKRYIYVDNIETTYYSANGYEMVEEFKNNKTYKKFRINLAANGKQIGIYVKSLEGTNQEKAIDRLRYFHKDALGNIDLITDIDGKVVARQHYAAFGKRTQNLSDDVVIDEVKRGFSSHEHIDELGLINMNARLYDPETARFLSADSFIQDPHLTLSHNRYIYVMNNPLKYTDPSGHFWNFIVGAIISYAASQSDNPFIRTIGMVVGGAMMGGAFGGETLFASTLHTKMAAGFVMGGINAGDAQGAILGAISAGLTYGIGHGGEIDAITGETTSYFDSFVGTAVAHGTTQGIIAEASGGSFQSGFASGFSGHLAGGLTEGLSAQALGSEAAAIVSQTTIVATLGGLASKATGGSFEDGAYRAATVHLFNKLGDIVTAKLKLGLNAGVRANVVGVAKVEVGSDVASGNRELIYNYKEGWRVDKYGSQGVDVSVEAYKYKYGYSRNRTHPVGQPKNWSNWKDSTGLTVNNIPLDGILGIQGGVIIQPGFELNLKELNNWWHDK